MNNKKTIVVGYSAAALGSLQQLRPEGSVILIDEPDVIRKRHIDVEVKKYSVVDRLIPFEYQRKGAADIFFGEHRPENIVSVVPIQEYATPFAARLAERLNRPGASYGASLIMRDKHRLRAVSKAFGIHNPASKIVESFEEARAFMVAHGGSVIIKPANRQGSVGAVIVRNAADIEDAWGKSQTRDEGVMVPDRGFEQITLVEQFVEGREFSVEALVVDGCMIFSNVTQKELFEGAHPVESGHTVPATIDSDLTEQLVSNTGKVIEATGFRTGIVHCEWMHDGTDAYLIECAGRFAGDGIIDLIERAYRFDIVKAYHAIMRGEQLSNLPVQAKKTAKVRFVGGKTGTVSEVRVDEAMLRKSGIAHFSVTVRAGDKTVEPSMSWQRLGSVTVEADTPDSAEQLISDAIAAINISYA
ncbi:ATP-grasp domain-containing protein [Burkholderia ubonensis]|uniref:ATP-grasp domain-containing protein n=1 Tax=Burkholderia ubonensis TaxID=101571 RepID=UPI000F564956|nr:ATP-grasp domain-containing protein [Burkholderia ubonensis]